MFPAALHALLADPAVLNATVAVVGGVFAWAYARVQGKRDAKLKIDIDQQTNAGLLQAVERAAYAALTRGGAPGVVPQIVADTIGQRMPDAIKAIVSKDPVAARIKLVGIAEDAVARIVSSMPAGAPVTMPEPAATGPAPEAVQHRSF